MTAWWTRLRRYREQRPPSARIAAVVALAAVTLGSKPSVAAAEAPAGPPQAPVADAEARHQYDEGLRHFEAGRYQAAIDEFEAAYRRTAAPGLLYDIAQAHRLLGDCAGALVYYRRFLAVRPGGEIGGLAALRIADMEQCLARAAATTAAPALRSPTPPMALLTNTAAPAGVAVTEVRPRRWRRGAGAAFALTAVASAAAAGYFAVQSRDASKEVSTLIGEGGTWGSVGMQREQIGLRDQTVAITLGVASVVSAAASVWLLVRR